MHPNTTLRLFSLALAAALSIGCSPPATEEAAPEPATEIRGGVFDTADGNQIVYDLVGSGDTTLVFIHCWACNRTFWKEQVAAFASDYRVLAMDLPGHGESSATREAWTVAGLAGDVQALVEELDLPRVVLVGHSMGGPVALLTAPLLADRAVGVACVDTLHDVSMPWDAEAIAPIVEIYSADFATANGRFVPMMFPEEADPATIEWVVENANRSDPDAAMGLMLDFPNLNLADLLAGAGVPVRCVNAAPMGQMIPPTAIESNRQHGDFDAVTLDGVGHYLLLEKPSEFNELLAGVVQALSETP